MKKISLFVIALIITIDLCKVFVKEISIFNKVQPINVVIHLVHLDVWKKGIVYNEFNE